MLELLNIHARSSINKGPEVLIHILWRTELLDSLKSPVQLVTENRNNVEARNHPLVINESLSLPKRLRKPTYPDLGIDLVSCLKMLRNVILFLGDGSQFLASVNAYSAHCLSQIRRPESITLSKRLHLRHIETSLSLTHDF